jgi:hypothetical protein
MIFTIGCAIVGVLAALMVTSPARKKQIDKATKKSPKKKAVASIQLSEADLSGKRKLDYHLRILKLACEFEVIYIDGTPGMTVLVRSFLAISPTTMASVTRASSWWPREGSARLTTQFCATPITRIPGVSSFGPWERTGQHMLPALLSCVRSKHSLFEPTTIDSGMPTLSTMNPT